MKTRFKFTPKTASTHQSKWMATALALAASMAVGGSAMAQDYITGAQYLSNITSNALETAPSALYAGWNPTTGFPATTINDVTSGSNQGLEIFSYGYGSFFYSIPASQQAALNPLDTEVSLTFTINSPTGPASGPGPWYVGVPFLLDDNNGNSGVSYGGYATFGPGTWTETAPLSAAMLTATEAGDEIINGLNLEFDPAGNLPNGSGPYDITFNSLTFEPAPEPASLALLGIGFAGLLAARRRK